MSSPFPSNLVAASHSGRVAWVFDAKGVRNLWVADAPNFAARQVTHYTGDEGLPIASLRITADGRTLVYVRGSEANESGRVADPTSGVWPRKQQVWAVEVDAGASPIAGRDGLRPEEECEDVELSPDGQFAVWAARQAIMDRSGYRSHASPSAHRIFAATMPVQDGLPMDGRSLSSASAAITASSPSTISGVKACVTSLRARIAMACRAGRRTEATSPLSGVPAFRRNCR